MDAKQVKDNSDLGKFRCGQQRQHVSMLGLPLLCEMQSTYGMAIYADDVHMAKIIQVQELINLDKWMQCNDHVNLAKTNMAKHRLTSSMLQLTIA